MKTKFIELTPSSGEQKYFINSTMICGMTQNENNRSTVYVFGGQIYNVKESVEEILKLIKESENITLITK